MAPPTAVLEISNDIVWTVPSKTTLVELVTPRLVKLSFKSLITSVPVVSASGVPVNAVLWKTPVTR